MTNNAGLQFCYFLLDRVFGCEGKTTSDVVIAAINRAINASADIINIPFTFGQEGFNTDLISSFVSRAARRGNRIITAVGDNGANGPFYVENPASASRAFSVGSFDTPATWKKVVFVNGMGYAYNPSVLGGAFKIASTAPIVFNGMLLYVEFHSAFSILTNSLNF
jgi:hypothetical protein